jgi:hypothetical protein
MSGKNAKKASKNIKLQTNYVSKNNMKDVIPKMTLILAIVIFIKIALSFLPSYKVDMGGYVAWSLYLAEKGFGGFYNTFHVVYGPIYMYMLLITGKLVTIFSLDTSANEFLVKFWSVLSDIIGGYLIYLIGRRYGKQKLGVILGVVYALNPAIFFNSSIWGQFDSIPSTMLLGVIYCFSLNKKVLAALLFVVAVITKPQSILLAPIVVILFLRDFAWKQLLEGIKKRDRLPVLQFFKEILTKIVQTVAGAVCIYVFSILPFYQAEVSSQGNTSRWLLNLFLWLPRLYLKSGADYPFATANGFNLWMLLGGQAPATDSDPFMGLTYAMWSIMLLTVISLFSMAIVVLRGKNPLVLYFTSYFLCFGAFMFGARMHERYLLPAFIFFTVCILWDKRLWVPMIILSFCGLANQWYLYALSKKEIFWIAPYDKAQMAIPVIVSIVTLAVMVYTILYIIIELFMEKKMSDALGRVISGNGTYIGKNINRVSNIKTKRKVSNKRKVVSTNSNKGGKG